MNTDQLGHFRKILEAWRGQLREEVDRTLNHMQDEAANFPDPVDRAAQEEEFSLELRARDRERKLIKKIEKTLQKLKMMISVSVSLAVSKLVFVDLKLALLLINASTAKPLQKLKKSRWQASHH